jgi:hypothetical protein
MSSTRTGKQQCKDSALDALCYNKSVPKRRIDEKEKNNGKKDDP